MEALRLCLAVHDDLKERAKRPGIDVNTEICGFQLAGLMPPRFKPFQIFLASNTALNGNVSDG